MTKQKKYGIMPKLALNFLAEEQDVYVLYEYNQYMFFKWTFNGSINELIISTSKEKLQQKMKHLEG
jgi:hypothetical protein